MKPHRLRALALAAVLAAASACGDDGGGTRVDATEIDTMIIDTPIDGPPELTFTAFVIDTVVNQTAGNRDPIPYASFSDLPDNDQNNPAAYAALFN